jgi:hypothetical protein
MIPAQKYRIVGVRADGSTRTLCGDMRSSELAQRVAKGLGDKSPFVRIIVERDDPEPPAGPHQKPGQH